MISAAPPATADSSKAGSASRTRLWTWLLLALVLIAAAGIRFRLREMPLERDEGEYAYTGQLILQGIPPYKLAYNMKFPGASLAYALIMVLFGQTPSGIHIGLLLVNAAATTFLFQLATRLADRRAGLVAASLYAFLSLHHDLVGTAAHATQFVVLALLPALLLLLSAVERKSNLLLFCSGLLLGVAILMKQHGMFFLLLAFAWIVFRRSHPFNWRNVLSQSATLALGVLLPLLAVILVLWHAGLFDRFWFWTIQYARAYATEYPGLHAVRLKLFDAIPLAFYPLALAAAFGLVVLLRKPDRSTAFFAAVMLGCSVVAVFPNFTFRPHYFILPLPPLALLAGVAVIAAGDLLRKRQLTSIAWLPITLFLASLSYGIFQQREIFFKATPFRASRITYGFNPFPEAAAISNYLKDHATPDDEVAVLGSEPEIYFYSRLHSATGYIYTYALVEEQPYALRMQREMISEIEAAHPAWLVVAAIPTSWLVQASSPSLIFDWSANFINSNYTRAGVVELFKDGHAEYRWNDAAQTRLLESPYNLILFRRKDYPAARHDQTPAGTPP